MNVDQGAKAIQTDWETREFLEIISVNMKKLTEFVNKFGKFCLFIKLRNSYLYFLLLLRERPIFTFNICSDLSVRYKLAKVNEKLSNLERQVEYLEGCYASVQQQQQ